MPKNNQEFESENFDQAAFDKLMQEEDSPEMKAKLEELEKWALEAANQQMLEYSNSATNEYLAELQADMDEDLRKFEESESLRPELEEQDVTELDPNLTASNVASWMLEQIKPNKVLYQWKAAQHIRKHFGTRFTYRNQNSNPAISREVLVEFTAISSDLVVWNKSKRYWRLRQSSDALNCRTVKD